MKSLAMVSLLIKKEQKKTRGLFLWLFCHTYTFGSALYDCQFFIVKGMSNRYLSKFKLGHIYLKEKKEKNDLFDDDDIADENTDKNTDSGEPQ